MAFLLRMAVQSPDGASKAVVVVQFVLNFSCRRNQNKHQVPCSGAVRCCRKTEPYIDVCAFQAFYGTLTSTLAVNFSFVTAEVEH